MERTIGLGDMVVEGSIQPPLRRLQELALAGKMQPLSSEVKTNPLQVANFCSRLFW